MKEERKYKKKKHSYPNKNYGVSSFVIPDNSMSSNMDAKDIEAERLFQRHVKKQEEIIRANLEYYKKIDADIADKKNERDNGFREFSRKDDPWHVYSAKYPCM